jgi:nicotinamidase/pyrazinamidase
VISSFGESIAIRTGVRTEKASYNPENSFFFGLRQENCQLASYAPNAPMSQRTKTIGGFTLRRKIRGWLQIGKPVKRGPSMSIDRKRSALVIVDAQRGFTTLCPQELPVAGGLEIVPAVNRLLNVSWLRVDATQDWHPPDHCSFLGREHNLYPPHCVMGTPGAEFLPGLHTELFHAIWRKGFQRELEAYAVTAQHPAFVQTLRASGVQTAVVCGIAANICCFFTARDLRIAGFDVVMVADASAGIDIPAAGLFQTKAKQEGESLGIRYLTVDQVVQ